MPPLPANLTLIAPSIAARPRPLTGRHGDDPSHQPVQPTVVLDCDELLETVERLGSLAATSPLSFLIVNVESLNSLRTDDAQLLMRLVSGRVRALTRATDTVGRMGPGRLGVLLQGAGATAAGAVAARIAHHLSQVVRNTNPLLSVRVSAATGTGANWDTLPIAAAEGLPDCG